MGSRKPSKTSLLLEAEVAAVVKGLESMFPRDAVSMFAKYGIEPADTVRFMALAERCRVAREARGLSLAAVALSLKLPQHRLRTIECNRVDAVRGADLDAYVAELGMTAWYRRWIGQNRELHARLHDREA